MYIILSLISVTLFSLVHIFVERIPFLRSKQRHAWLSFSGGVAIAYVFIHILPDLASKHEVLAARQSSVIHGLLASNVYLVALAGLITYYGLGKLAELESSERATYFESQSSRKISTSILLVIYATYPMLIAYLTTELNNPFKLFLITIAMSLHFIGTDYGIYHRDKYLYDRVIRWILVAATYLGWVIGILTEVSETTIVLWFAFIAGAIIINTIKEELPEHEVSRFLPFLAGTIAFTILILIVESLFPD